VSGQDASSGMPPPFSVKTRPYQSFTSAFAFMDGSKQSSAVTTQSHESNDPEISFFELVTHSNVAVISFVFVTADALVLELA
jgi:hypothetical protein